MCLSFESARLDMAAKKEKRRKKLREGGESEGRSKLATPTKRPFSPSSPPPPRKKRQTILFRLTLKSARGGGGGGGGGGVEKERTRKNILACVVCVSERRLESVRMRGACARERVKRAVIASALKREIDKCVTPFFPMATHVFTF